MNFSQISYKLLTNYLQITYKFCTDFLQISWKFLGNFLEISCKFLANFLQISFKFLTNFSQISFKFLTNFLQTACFLALAPQQINFQACPIFESKALLIFSTFSDEEIFFSERHQLIPVGRVDADHAHAILNGLLHLLGHGGAALLVPSKRLGGWFICHKEFEYNNQTC
jgi:hypothetical protein